MFGSAEIDRSVFIVRLRIFRTPSQIFSNSSPFAFAVTNSSYFVIITAPPLARSGRERVKMSCETRS